MELLDKWQDEEDISEEYVLDGFYPGSGSFPGALIVHLLYSNPDLNFIRFFSKPDTDIHDTYEPFRIFKGDASESSLGNIQNLINQLVSKDMVNWVLRLQYKGNMLVFSGEIDNTTIRIRYLVEPKVNLLPIISQLEQQSYNFHGYDVKFVEMLKKTFKLTQKNAVLNMDKLTKHPDIQEEFLTCMKYESFEFPKITPLTVEGYSAQQLFENFPLNELGAYNYLIYLREKPEEAKHYLKLGLPRH